MIKAVLFDLGGTLHNSSSPAGRDVWFCQRILDRLEDYGIRLEGGAALMAQRLAVNSEIYKHESEKTLRELPAAQVWSEYYLREYGLTAQQMEPFAEELSFLYDYERPCVMRRPHLKETMETLKAMGFRLGVISNIISRSVVRHFLAEYGIEDMMDCVITSAETGIRKPSPEIFRIAEKAMGLGPEELAYVGDTISRDVIGTRRAGWAIMIQIKNPSIAHRDVGLENAGWEPDYRIDDLSEIPEILKQL